MKAVKRFTAVTLLISFLSVIIVPMAMAEDVSRVTQYGTECGHGINSMAIVLTTKKFGHLFIIYNLILRKVMRF